MSDDDKPEAEPETKAPVIKVETNGHSSAQMVQDLVRARYSLVHIVSSEEERVETALEQVAEARGKRIAYWSCTEGITFPDGSDQHLTKEQKATLQSPAMRQPVAALEVVLKAGETTEDMPADVKALYEAIGSKVIFVLRDMHHYTQNPTVLRKLRDCAKYLRRGTGKTCVLLSPQMDVPSDLEKEIAVVDYDLPSVEDLRHTLDGVLDSLPPALKGQIGSDGKHLRRVAESALGLSKIEAENVFALSLVQKRCLDVAVINAEKEQIIRKSGTLDFLRPKESLDGVGGLSLLKDWLHKRTRAFSPEARDYGLPQPKGVLLLGVPGCGKSLVAKIIANLWRLPMLRLDMGKMFGGLVGKSEENMRRATKTAESIAPAVMWLDEVEKGLSGTGSSNHTDGGTANRVFGTFLTWLQEKEKPVFVVATANNVKQLPPELLRKGRFDEIFFVDLPDLAERTEIVKIHITLRRRDPADYDVGLLAAEMKEFSGSEIEQAIVAAMHEGFDNGREFTTDDILAAARATVPLSTTMSEDIAAMREWAKARARPASEKKKVKKTAPSKGRKIEM